MKIILEIAKRLGIMSASPRVTLTLTTNNMTSTPWTKQLCELSEYNSDEIEICLLVAGGFDNARDTLNRDQWEGTEEDREEFARLAINSPP